MTLYYDFESIIFVAQVKSLLQGHGKDLTWAYNDFELILGLDLNLWIEERNKL